MKIRWTFAGVLSVLLIMSTSDGMEAGPSTVVPGPVVDNSEVIYLDQGWTADERQEFYHTSPGTQLLPYDWFVALRVKQPNGDEPLFKDIIRPFGLIPDPSSMRNPHKVPVGLAETPLSTRQLGITCAFCHTSQMTYRGQTIRIDGGSSMQYNALFGKALIDALNTTLKDEDMFKDFAQTILSRSGNQAADSAALRKKLKRHSKGMFLRAASDPSVMEWGPGRLDALGRGGNLVFGQLDLDNFRHANAPASIPPLWNAWTYDWVQWNGSIQHPLARNIGQVIGVNADLFTNSDDHFTPYVDPHDRFRSSLDITKLIRMEGLSRKLKPPAWPRQFPPIDQHLADQGKELYHGDKLKGLPNLCAHCHVPKPLPKLTDHGQSLQVTMIPLSEIGTDPSHASNFRSRNVSTGEPPPNGLAMGRMSASAATEYVTTEIMKREGLSVGSENKWQAELQYIARPHAAIWATPPYLHNGSVPNLYELLLPAEQRHGCFYVGPDFEFDPRHVGFVVRECDGKSTPRDPDSGFEFDTARPGNGNTGHEFRNDDRAGHTFTLAECKELTEHARDGIIGCGLTDPERMAIIEYLKTL